jgi:hypothetical protein
LLNAFTIQNGVKQGHASSPSLLNFASEYVIKKVQESIEWDTSLWVCADDVNVLCENIRKKNRSDVKC